MNIVYKEIDKRLEEQIVETWGAWVIQYGCLYYGEGCYSLAAIVDGVPVGFISTHPMQLPKPLDMHYDAYISDLEVDENYRRKGIASRLLAMMEEWAKEYGYRQLRAWSSDNEVEAISMWYALGYGVCPAIMRV